MLTIKNLAHALVLFFAIGFLFSHSLIPQVMVFSRLSSHTQQIWQHFFEGGLVGALADWFAVTALFRRPLGIPFPHSAIIVQKQAQIAKQFGVFVEDKFLSPEVVKTKVASVNMPQVAIDFLGNAEKRTALSLTAGGFFYSFKELALSPALIGLISKSITDTLRLASFKSVQQALRTALLKNKNIDPLLDRFLKSATRFIEEEKDMLRARVKKSMPWFVPTFVDDKLYEMLVTGITAWIQEIQSDPVHPFRAKIKERLDHYLGSDSSRITIENLKNELLDSKDWQEFVENFFAGLKGSPSEQLTDGVEGSPKNPDLLSRYIAQMLEDLKTKLELDPKFQESFQNVSEHFITTVAGAGRGVVGSLITETLQGWNTKTLVSSIEGSIGADLQYIRINGTVLGSFLGIFLYIIGSR